MWVDSFSLDFYRATMTQPYVTRFVHADTLNCDFLRYVTSLCTMTAKTLWKLRFETRYIKNIPILWLNVIKIPNNILMRCEINLPRILPNFRTTCHLIHLLRHLSTFIYTIFLLINRITFSCFTNFYDRGSLWQLIYDTPNDTK